jgi:arsenate reductase (glutaredoxin)
MIIYYNPDCSKCKEALEIMDNEGCSYEVRNYLQNPPSVKELRELTTLLNCHPLEITRKKESLYLEKFEGKNLTIDELYEALSANPILIERPIVLDGTQAIIGRPPSIIRQLIKGKSKINGY